MRRDAVDVGARRRLVHVGRQPSRKFATGCPVPPPTMLLLKRNTPKSSAPVKFTGLVQLNHWMSKPAFHRVIAADPRQAVGHLKRVLCQRLFLALAESRVAGDVDVGRARAVGHRFASSRRPSSLASSVPTLPVVNPWSAFVKPKRASLREFDETAKLSDTTNVDTGFSEVRGPRLSYVVGDTRCHVLPAQAAEHRVAGAEVLIDPDVELVRHLGGVRGIPMRGRALVRAPGCSVCRSLLATGIDARRRYDVAWERRPVCGSTSGVVSDGEVAAPKRRPAAPSRRPTETA